MKALMENWNRYLNEEDMRSQIMAYLEENNIILTEQEIEEAMPRWMKKIGTGAALAATLAGAGAPSQAQADTHQFRSEPTHQQMPAAEGFQKNTATGDYEFRVTSKSAPATPFGKAAKAKATNGLIGELVEQGVLELAADGSVDTSGLSVEVERSGEGYQFVAKWNPESAESAEMAQQKQQTSKSSAPPQSKTTVSSDASEF
jgi:hypothetical protein